MRFGTTVDREINARVHECAAAIAADGIPGVCEIVPAYAAIAVYYDPATIGYSALAEKLHAVASRVPVAHDVAARGRLVEIPVRYNGPDLSAVAESTGLTAAEVVARHTAPEYLVYMLGFAPGFAYLGDLDPALRLPRRTVPRTRVPRGSVAVAGAQTAVYPLETPGGWHLIGSTDLILFDPRREAPALLRAGDRVKFVAIG